MTIRDLLLKIAPFALLFAICCFNGCAADGDGSATPAASDDSNQTDVQKMQKKESVEADDEMKAAAALLQCEHLRNRQWKSFSAASA